MILKILRQATKWQWHRKHTNVPEIRSHLAILSPFVAAVLCRPWYSVIWIIWDLGSSANTPVWYVDVIHNSCEQWLPFQGHFLTQWYGRHWWTWKYVSIKKSIFLIAHITHDSWLPLWKLYVKIVEVVAWTFSSFLEVESSMLQMCWWLCNLFMIIYDCGSHHHNHHHHQTHPSSSAMFCHIFGQSLCLLRKGVLHGNHKFRDIMLVSGRQWQWCYLPWK